MHSIIIIYIKFQKKTQTWIQSVVRLPTVVNCAGWKWVNPNVGRSRYWAAKMDRREMRTPREWMRYVRPSRKKIKSALLVPARISKTETCFWQLIKNRLLSYIARSCTQAVLSHINFWWIKNLWTKWNELDNPGSSRCDLSESVYMSHNIMATFLLFNSSHLELFRGKVLSWRTKFDGHDMKMVNHDQ